MKNKKIKVFIIVGVVLLCLGWTYFTTYAETKNPSTEVGDTTLEIHEEIEGMNKHIKVKNIGGFQAYVRVKAFVGDKYKLSYTNGNNWQAGDGGYYYYSAILAPGETTDEIIIKVENSEDEFNVIVVAESTKVLYDENGDEYANWNAKADII